MSISSIIEQLYYLLIFFRNTIEEIFYHRMKAPKSDVSGQVFVITGGNAGIGKDIARQVLLMNPKKVYITSRSAERGQKALSDLRAATGKDNIEVISLDLNSFASVQKAAEELKKKEEKIDVLVLNAGVGYTDAGSKSQDGYDAMYQSNHLGHHLFFELLLPNVRAASKPGKPARVQLTSSAAHYFASEGSLAQMESGLSGMSQYGNTKIMNLLMARYYSKKYSDISINGVHPGGVASDFAEKFPPLTQKLLGPIAVRLFRTVESGAATSVFVATHPSAANESGKYWSNMKTLSPHRIAEDDKIAEKYMNISFNEIKLKKNA